jgi:flagellar basal-body rod protein FlgB
MLDGIFGVHEKAMELRQHRLALLGQNIANADTPHYKAKDVDFKKIMARETDFSVQLSQPGHMSGTNSRNPALVYRTPTNPAADGNTVELNYEQAQFGKESARYQATLQFLENRIGGIRRALRGE